MELDACQLYADKTWVGVDAALTSNGQKTLMQRALAHAETLMDDDISASIEKLSRRQLFYWKTNKALFIGVDFDPYEFHGIITANSFGQDCIVSTYKLLLGDSFFAVNHSQETRRRAVIDALKDVEIIDYFFYIEKLVDRVSDYVVAQVQQGD